MFILLVAESIVFQQCSSSIKQLQEKRIVSRYFQNPNGLNYLISCVQSTIKHSSMFNLLRSVNIKGKTFLLKLQRKLKLSLAKKKNCVYKWPENTKLVFILKQVYTSCTDDFPEQQNILGKHTNTLRIVTRFQFDMLQLTYSY